MTDNAQYYISIFFSSKATPDCRMNRVLSNSATGGVSLSSPPTQAQQGDDESQRDRRNQFYHNYNDSRRTQQQQQQQDATFVASGEHSFLESHIASIGQWLTSNAI